MSAPQSPTYYDVLGVQQNATKEEISKAYRRAMRVAHPDTSGSTDSPLAVLVSQAYEVLRDVTKRAQYDQSLASSAPENAGSTSQWGVEDEWVEETPSYAESTGYPEPEPAPYFAQPTPIDLNKLSWWSKTQDLGEVTYTPGKRSVLNAVLLTVLGLALYIGIPQWGIEDTDMRVIFGAFQILGLLLLLPFAFGKKGKAAWSGFIITGLGLAGFFAGPAKSLGVAAFLLGTTVLMSGAALAWRKWRVGRGAGTDDTAPLALVRGTRVFGDPGVGLYNAINFFGAENVAKGVHGERMTADALEHLLTLPGVRIIHGLQFPGSQKADVDHAVICGNRVAFIDSKYWSGGHWAWDAPGVVVNYRTPGQHGYPRTLHFQNAVESFRKSLKGLEVQGWVLIHSNDAYRIHTDNSKANGQPRLVDSQQALEEIGAWLLEGQPTVVNRTSVLDLLKIKN